MILPYDFFLDIFFDWGIVVYVKFYRILLAANNREHMD